MPRNRSERFPHSDAIQSYLAVWATWDAAGRPMGGPSRKTQKEALEALSEGDLSTVVNIDTTQRWKLIKEFKLHAS